HGLGLHRLGLRGLTGLGLGRVGLAARLGLASLAARQGSLRPGLLGAAWLVSLAVHGRSTLRRIGVHLGLGHDNSFSLALPGGTGAGNNPGSAGPPGPILAPSLGMTPGHTLYPGPRPRRRPI